MPPDEQRNEFTAFRTEKQICARVDGISSDSKGGKADTRSLRMPTDATGSSCARKDRHGNGG